MADQDQSYNFEGSTEELLAEIQRMEKEKVELERKNKERQQLEQTYKQLKGSVTNLKASTSGAGQSTRPNQQSSRDMRLPENRRGESGSNIQVGSLNCSLEESHAQLRAMQQSILGTSLGGASSFLDDSREDQDRSAVEVDEDDVMSDQHKNALRQNRDVLVDNMTPDDIFNDMISKHILTNSDVSRIKEKNTIEAMNEELLNMIVRRSDRAFYVLVNSLRRTLQGWLANRLDPPSQNKGKRKRRTGEVNVNVDCEHVMPSAKKRYACTCQEVEEQILVMAKGAFANIRRRDATPAAFEQFRKELQQTNEIIKDSMEIMHTLKILCRHGELTDLSEGSVCFTIRCASYAACKALWKDVRSGTILRAVRKGLITHSLLRICGAEEIRLRVRVDKIDYLTCALEMAYSELQSLMGNHRQFRSYMRQKREMMRSGKENVPFCKSKTKPTAEDTLRRAFQHISPNTVSPLLNPSSQQSIMNPRNIFPQKSNGSIDSLVKPMSFSKELKENSACHASKGCPRTSKNCSHTSEENAILLMQLRSKQTEVNPSTPALCCDYRHYSYRLLKKKACPSRGKDIGTSRQYIHPASRGSCFKLKNQTATSYNLRLRPVPNNC